MLGRWPAQHHMQQPSVPGLCRTAAALPALQAALLQPLVPAAGESLATLVIWSEHAWRTQQQAHA
jgi:hypothetical protein